MFYTFQYTAWNTLIFILYSLHCKGWSAITLYFYIGEIEPMCHLPWLWIPPRIVPIILLHRNSCHNGQSIKLMFLDSCNELLNIPVQYHYYACNPPRKGRLVILWDLLKNEVVYMVPSISQSMIGCSCVCVCVHACVRVHVCVCVHVQSVCGYCLCVIMEAEGGGHSHCVYTRHTHC